MNLVTPKVGAKHEQFCSTNRPHGPSDRFVEQKLMLSSSFRCYQIHNCHRYDFGHTFFVKLKSDLDIQQTRLVKPLSGNTN
jgi:hypothetical protein